MIKKYLNRVFIDGLSGMALGLFSTLIIGTILCQIGKIVGDNFVGEYLIAIGGFAKIITGAGIGVGVAAKLKSSPLATVSAAVAGMIGAYPKLFIALEKTIEISDGASFVDSVTKVLGGPGEPMGAFIAAYIAIEIGSLISGKTKIDIVLTPLCCIISGATAGYLIGPYISKFMKYLGALVSISVDEYPIMGGMIVAVMMGIFLTLPISSAAIGVAMNLTGLAAGAAVVGCCCNMVGFAVISYRENKVSGLIAQGIGTSMLQMPNIIKKPIIWLPAILSSAILGPVSAALLKMTSNATGSGMGSAGLVGQFMTYETMAVPGANPVIVILEIVLMHFVAPALLSLGIAELMRKLKWIKSGDLKLQKAD